jgi:hypothetical protein
MPDNSASEYKYLAHNKINKISQAYKEHTPPSTKDSTPITTKRTFFCGQPFTIHKRAHAVIVQRVALAQINHIKAVFKIGSRVADAIVEPLRVSPRVVVRVENKIVFCLVNLSRERNTHSYKYQRRIAV